MENKEEIWKDIIGYEGLYKVSSVGNIKSLRCKGLIREKTMKLSINENGYLMVNLCKNNKVKIWRVHRIVLTAFVPNQENKCDVNHINGIKTDNRVENLEWNTRSENLCHAFRTGLRINGEKNRIASGKKCRERCSKKVINIVTKEIYESCKEASKKYGISKSHLSNMLTGVKKNKTNLIYLE